ncbi:alpha/beta-hydrolase [Aaosphaeria arxii CBS 175.79]|uniref:Alpha/beta-hydrolase n=1 Tax=Aaosphaeria arxii CBS 175.79 TaxID=1450172 RepID=A0A6A5Y781_9PLEO|nr:alpha/beta-hydrolase [Aaosphaeria arxii CBS 175.79]KAF2020414.1 alpha/beta-hydrolase [Aaosphaeria arxii CBS 175.79]
MSPATISTHVYKTVGDLNLTVDLHAPPNFNSDTGMVLVHFHGGYLLLGEKTTFMPHWLINACHQRGWAFATPSYRLLPEASGTDVVQDAFDAVVWIMNNIAKSGRMFLAGSSAGGYLALAATAHPNVPPITALLLMYGMLDPTAPRYVKPGQAFIKPLDSLDTVVADLGKAQAQSQPLDSYAFPADPMMDRRYTWVRALHEGALYMEILTGVHGLAKQVYDKGSNVIPAQFRPLFPATFGLRAGLPPTVLLHGEDDIAVNVQLSRTLAYKLQELDNKVLLEVVPDQGHGFDVTHGRTVITSLNRWRLTLERAASSPSHFCNMMMKYAA